MITTETGAYQEMAARLREVLALGSVATIVGYAPEVRYVDVNYTKDAPKDKVWLRFGIVQGGEKKRTLGVRSRKTHQGVADIQLFVPANANNPAEIGRKVADVLLSVYDQSTASVDFFSAYIRDMPKEDAWFYKRISATYNYDTYS